MDTEGLGYLTKGQVREAYRELCDTEISEAELTKLFGAVDMDGSGKLEYTEFCVACIDRSTLLSDQNLELSFKMLDTTGTGEVTTKDLKNVFNQFNLHDRVISDLMKQADKNGSGKIT